MQDVSGLWDTPTAQQLVTTLTSISEATIMQNFLRDVMTEKEIIEISARLEAAKMLRDGKKYTDIIEKTKLSSRTIARISDWMQNGQGGYGVVLKTIDTAHNHIPPVHAE